MTHKNLNPVDVDIPSASPSSRAAAHIGAEPEPSGAPLPDATGSALPRQPTAA